MQDVLRYVLTVNAPETKDNDFTWKEFQIRNNSELVAIYGNFVNRVLILIIKYYSGIVPNPDSLDNSNKKIISEIIRKEKRFLTNDLEIINNEVDELKKYLKWLK